MSPDITFNYCMIRSKSLASKNFDKIFQDSISVIDFIKAKALDSRLFYNTL